MEGYLSKKGRGEGNFGRRTWKKRWCVLEDQNLIYYEDLDIQSGMPVHQKGSINLAGTLCSIYTHHEKKYTFIIKSDTESDCIFQAPDTRLMNLWIQEINKSARGENLLEKPNYLEMYKLLGLNMKDNPDAAEIGRAYRKKALRCHPDKGGDMLEFKKLQEAFNRINAKLDEDERMQHIQIITYECILMKNPGEVALALSVREEPETRRILIKEVLPGVKIMALTPESQGVVLPDDCLIKVREEDIRGMPLLRVAQKLNDFRVPPNSTVKLTFERRVDLSAQPPVPPAEDAYNTNCSNNNNEYYPSDEFMYNTQSTSFYPSNNPTSFDAAQGMSPEYDIDETTPEERAAASAGNSPTPTHKHMPRPPSVHQATTANSNEHNTSSHKFNAHLDPVAYVSTMSENEELRAEIDAKDSKLQAQAAKQEQLEAQLLKMQQALTAAQMANKQTQEQLLDSQLRHRMTKEQMQMSIQTMLDVSKRVASAQQKHQQAQHDVDIATLLLSDGSVMPSKQQKAMNCLLQTAQLQDNSSYSSNTVCNNDSSIAVNHNAARLAVVAAAMMDTNGTFSTHYSSPAYSLRDLLLRFETRCSAQPSQLQQEQTEDFLLDEGASLPVLMEQKTQSWDSLFAVFVKPAFQQQSLPLLSPMYQPTTPSQPQQQNYNSNKFAFDDYGESMNQPMPQQQQYYHNQAMGGGDLLDDFGGLGISPNNENQSLFGSVMSTSNVSAVPKVQIPGSLVPRPTIGTGGGNNNNNTTNNYSNAGNLPSYAQPKNARVSITNNINNNVPAFVNNNNNNTNTAATGAAGATVGITSPGLVKRRQQQFLSGSHGGGGDMDFQ